MRLAAVVMMFVLLFWRKATTTVVGIDSVRLQCVMETLRNKEVV